MTEAFISVGSNVDRVRNLHAADAELRGLGEVRHSRVFESEAIGFEGDAFYNLVSMLTTDLSLAELAETLDRIETEHGRVRNGERFGPRTLDLDLLLYGDTVIDTPQLRVPRAEITRYAFMLQPLAELAGEHLHPQLGRSFNELWEAFDDDSQRLWPIPFAW